MTSPSRSSNSSNNIKNENNEYILGAAWIRSRAHSSNEVQRDFLFLVLLSFQGWIPEVLIISWTDFKSPRLAVALLWNAVNDLMSLLVHICDSGTTECFYFGFGGQKELKLHKLECVQSQFIQQKTLVIWWLVFGTWLVQFSTLFIPGGEIWFA